jgi:predicted short-subunit dehydrogenase-like oxidoreductase (DUF2520 family)
MKISIIGGGKVAFHLSNMLKEVQHFELFQILIRNKESQAAFTSFENLKIIDNYNQLSNEVDIILIAVNDDQISSVSNSIQALDLFENKYIFHTSGKFTSSVFLPYFKNFGIFYPLQTFSFLRNPDYTKIPFCISASNKVTKQILLDLASSISSNINVLTDQEREKIHLAAVIVNNFTNHLYSIAEDYLEKNNIEFDLLKPLIRETIDKLDDLTPKEAQTGPAKRGDIATIQNHLSLIKDQKELSKLYKMISKSINKDLKI